VLGGAARWRYRPPLDLNGSVLPQARLGWARLAGADLRGAGARMVESC
jgi:hypothetical protein